LSILKPFRSAFTKSDLMSGDIICTAGLYNKLGEFIMPAGLHVALGFGRESGQENAQGRIYMDLKTAASVVVSGTVRLSVFSPQNRSMRVLDEWRTEALAASTDRTKQIPLPFNGTWVSEDKKYVLEFMPDVTATVAKAQSTVTIDVTKRETVG
jgi:hypothetical protein